MPLTILRAISDRDFRDLHGVFAEYELDLPEDLRHGSVPDVDDLASSYSGNDAAFIAREGDTTIGCVAVRRLDAWTALILRLYVSPQYRGAGTARCLVTTALAYLRSKRYARVVLDTEKGRLPAAFRLYQSLGFAECAPFASVTYETPTFMELWLRGSG